MTKLTRDHARRQANRLQACPMLAPQSDEGKREVVDCLMRHCQSAEHAETVMTQFLDGALHVQNSIAELAAIAHASRQNDQPPPGCDLCYLGPDFSTGEVRWAAHVSVDRNGLAFARRCSCARGQYLNAADVVRAAALPGQGKSAHVASAGDAMKRAAEDQA